MPTQPATIGITPLPPKPYRVYYNPRSRQFLVDGALYDVDDITGLMGQARADLSGPPKRPPTPAAKGWRGVDTDVFLERSLPIIGERGIGTIASKGFGRGVDILQQLGGRAVQATQIPGIADWGRGVAEDQAEQLRRTQYYATGLGDIEGAGDFGRWVVGALAEQAPMILATAGIGWQASILAKAAHTANVARGAKATADAVKAARASPTVQAAVRAGSDALRQTTAKAATQAFKGANRYERMGAAFARLSGNKEFARRAKAAATKRMRGEVLDAAEAKVLSQAARITGAGFGLLGAQYGMGVGDIYGEVVESNTPGTTRFGASALAFAAAAPYAAIGATGEGVVARQLLKGVFKPKELAGRLAATRRRLAQAGSAGLTAAAAEGVAEAGQEGIVIGARHEYTGEGEEAEDLRRLLEAAATGALVGGVLGGAGGAARRPATPTRDFVGEAPVAEPEEAEEPEAGATPPAGPVSDDGQVRWIPTPEEVLAGRAEGLTDAQIVERARGKRPVTTKATVSKTEPVPNLDLLALPSRGLTGAEIDREARLVAKARRIVLEEGGTWDQSTAILQDPEFQPFLRRNGRMRANLTGFHNKVKYLFEQRREGAAAEPKPKEKTSAATGPESRVPTPEQVLAWRAEGLSDAEIVERFRGKPFRRPPPSPTEFQTVFTAEEVDRMDKPWLEDDPRAPMTPYEKWKAELAFQLGGWKTGKKSERIEKGIDRVTRVFERGGGTPEMATEALRSPKWNPLIWTTKGEIRKNLTPLRQRVEWEVSRALPAAQVSPDPTAEEDRPWSEELDPSIVPASEQAGAPPLGAQPAVSPPAQAAPSEAGAATTREPVDWAQVTDPEQRVFLALEEAGVRPGEVDAILSEPGFGEVAWTPPDPDTDQAQRDRNWSNYVSKVLKELHNQGEGQQETEDAADRLHAARGILESNDQPSRAESAEELQRVAAEQRRSAGEAMEEQRTAEVEELLRQARKTAPKALVSAVDDLPGEKGTRQKALDKEDIAEARARGEELNVLDRAIEKKLFPLPPKTPPKETRKLSARARGFQEDKRVWEEWHGPTGEMDRGKHQFATRIRRLNRARVKHGLEPLKGPYAGVGLAAGSGPRPVDPRARPKTSAQDIKSKVATAELQAGRMSKEESDRRAKEAALTEKLAQDANSERSVKTSGDVLAKEAAAKDAPAEKGPSGDPKAKPGELRLRRDYAKLDGTGTTPVDGVPLGQVKAFVRRRLSKLRNKPAVTVTRDAASLAREAPAVYRAALAEDPDFARKQVHGAFLYVDGKPHAIFFSKHTKSEGQLNYTFAHEVLGHYGLRGVMNRQELKRALAALEKDLKISAEADKKQATYDGMGRGEALEEALADYAADIDTGLLNRIWTILKNALNRFGVEFYDDNARHLVWSARRFTHRGGDRSMRYFRSFTMRDQAVAVEAHGRGMRYARKPNASLYGMGTVNHDPDGTLREQLNEWWAATPLKDRVVHSWEAAYQKVIGNLMTTDANAARSPLFELVWKLTNSTDREAKQAEARIKKLLERVMNEVRGGPYETELTRAVHLLRFHTRDKLEKWLAAGNTLPDVVTIDENGIASIDEKAFDELMELGRVDPSRIANRERFPFKDAGSVTRYYQVPKKYSKEEAQNIARWHEQVHNAIRDSARQRLERDVEMFNARANKATEGLSAEKAAAYRKVVGWYRDELRRLTEDGGREAKKDIDQLGNLRSAVEARLTGNATSYLYRKVPDADRLELWQKAGDKMKELGIDVPPDPTQEEAKGRAKDAAAASRTISKLSALDTDLYQASDTAAKTVAEGYVPFRRFGMYQVNLIAVDPNTGKRVPNLTNDAVRQLYYSQMESRSAMDREVKRLEDLAKELGTIKLTAYDAQDQIQTVDVKLAVESGTKGEPVFLPDNADFGKMLGVLDRAGNAISANAYRKMADLYLSGAALQRNRTLELQRTPGESKDLFRSVSGWAIGNANESAKRKYLPWINEALQDNELAEPSEAELDRRIAEYEAMPAGFEKDTAKRALENFLLQYRFSAPRGRTFTNPFDGKTYETRGRGGYYRNQAVKLRDFVGDPTTIRQSSDNLFRSGVVGKMTTATMVMQLGGSPATAFLNITSIFLNSLPYLSSRNSATGYGEGHNPIQVAAMLTRTGRHMVDPRLADVNYLERLAGRSPEARKLRRKHGLEDRDEAIYLLKETEKGLLQASLSNEMMGASRGHAKTKARRKAIEGWMWMFQHTESFSRRTVALAAYRLERGRLKDLGVDPTSQVATDAMYEAGRRTVSRSQGVYEAYNRPAWARNDLGRMLFTYKQFVITTLQMFMSLNLKGKAMFLGALFLAGGLSELPFSQDIMDFGNSLQAAFGIRSHSIEQHIIDYSDAVVPGLGKYMLYGFLNPLVGSNIGQRTGMGDVLPSSGIFRPGTDWGAEATQFLGPVYSAAEGSLALIGATFKQLVEAVGGKPDATNISDVGKTSPIAFIRNTTNAALYLTNGQAIGKNGKTAATNLGPWNAALQVFGFSPWSSAANYLFMKQYRYTLENAKSWRWAYVRMAMDAHFDGDQRAVREVFRDVQDHNQLVRQGKMPAEYEIRNFPRSFREAVRYGDVSAVERAAGGLPKRDRQRYIRAAAAAGAG